MKLCSGQCKYLLTIYELSCSSRVIRSVDIANRLSVTRSSVSRMLKCMARLELINSDYSLSVELTELGNKTARKLSANFEMIYSFFSEIIKLPEKEAYDQSILFIANFPENTVDKLSHITKNTLSKRNQK